MRFSSVDIRKLKAFWSEGVRLRKKQKQKQKQKQTNNRNATDLVKQIPK